MADEIPSPDKAANDAYKAFKTDYIERVATTLKENWDANVTGKAAPTNEEFKDWATQLTKGAKNPEDRGFTFKDDQGNEQKITIKEMQAGIDMSDAAKKKLDSQFQTHNLNDIILTDDQLEGAAKTVKKSVLDNRSNISLLGGASILNAILGLVQWFMGGCEGGMDGLKEAIADRSVDSIANQTEEGLKHNVPTIKKGMRDAIVSNISTAASEQAGLSTPQPHTGLKDVAIGSALVAAGAATGQTPAPDASAQAPAADTPAPSTPIPAPTAAPTNPAPITPSNPASVETAATHDQSERAKFSIQNGIDSVSLVDLGNAHPTGAMSAPDHIKSAKDLATDGKNISFYNDKTQQYEALAAGTPAALSAAIANDTSKRIKIMAVGDDGKPEAHYFEQVAHMGRDDNKSGAAGSAWKEVDSAGKPLNENGQPLAAGEKSTYHLSFPGYTDSISPFIMKTSPQRQSLEHVTEGQLNDQAADAAQFTHNFIQKTGKDNIAAIITGSHSLGASNALAADVVCDAEGVKRETTLLIEPAGATLAAKKITEAMDSNHKDSAFHKKLNEIGISDAKLADMSKTEDLSKNTESLRVVYKDQQGIHQTTVANLVPVPQDKLLDKTANPALSGENPIIAGTVRTMAPGADPTIDNGMLGKGVAINAPAGTVNPESNGHFETTIEAALLNNKDMMLEVTKIGSKMQYAQLNHTPDATHTGGAANIQLAENSPPAGPQR